MTRRSKAERDVDRDIRLFGEDYNDFSSKHSPTMNTTSKRLSKLSHFKKREKDGTLDSISDKPKSQSSTKSKTNKTKRANVQISVALDVNTPKRNFMPQPMAMNKTEDVETP